MARWKKIFRMAAFAAAGLVLLLAAAIGAATLYLRTETGRDWLAATIADAASGPEMTLTVARIEGRPPWDMTIATIAVADPDGVWLTVEQAHLDIDPWALATGTLSVGTLSAVRVAVARSPAGGEDQDDGDGALVPDLPLAIDVRHLEIDALELGPAILGEERRYAIEGAVNLHGRAARVELAVTPAGKGEALDLAALFDDGAGRLDIDLAYREPTDGLVAQAAGLTTSAPLSLRVAGTGPLDDWSGTIRATHGEVSLAAIDLAAVGRSPTVVRLSGTVAATPALLPSLKSIGSVEAVLDGALAVEAERIVLERLSVSARDSTLTLAGAFDRGSGDLDGRLDIAIPRTGRWIRPADAGIAAADVAIRARIGGSLDDPRLEAEASVGRLAGTGWTAANVTAGIEARRDEGNVYRAALSATVPDGSTLPGGLDGPIALNLSAILDRDFTTVDLAALDLTARDLSVSGGASLDLTGAPSRFDLRLRADELGRIDLLAGLIEAGALDFRLAGETRLDDLAATAAGFSAAGNGLVWTDPALADAVGARVTAEGRLAGDPDGGWRIADTTVATAAFGLGLAANIGPAFDAGVASYNLRVDRLAALSTLAGAPLSGSASGRGVVRLQDGGLFVDGNIEGSDVVYDQLAVGTVSVTSTVTPGVDGPTGLVAVSVPALPIPVDAEIAYRFEAPDRLILPRIEIAAGGGRIAGELALALDTLLAEGRLAARDLDLGALDVLLDAGLDGRLDADATFDARDGTQRLTVDLRGAPLSFGGERIDTVNARLAGSIADLAITLNAARAQFPAMDLALEAAVRQDEETIRIALASLSATVEGEPIALARPAAATVGDAGLSIADLDLIVGQGRLTADLEMGQRLDGTVRIAAVDLERLSALVPGIDLVGRLDGDLVLSGTAEAPAARLTTQLALPTNQGLPPAVLSAEGSWAGREAVLRARLEQVFDAPLTAELTFPLIYEATDRSIALPPDGRIAGTISGRGGIAPLGDWAPGGIRNLAGTLDSDLRITGTIGAPVVDGQVVLSELRLDHEPSGAALRGGRIVARAQRTTDLTLTLEGNDGGTGRLSGDGRLDLAAANGFDLDASMALDRFTLAGRDDLIATISADLAARGDAERVALTGRITANRAEIAIPDTLPQGVVVIDYEHENCPSCPQPVADEDRPAPPIEIGLEIDVDLPNQVFVRGRGVESEWRGALRIEGTAAAPRIVGRLETVSGNISVIGRTFTIERGRITFTGGNPPNPDLNVRATTAADGVIAAINVTGTANDPEIALTSEPPLPEDEILSRILFGSATSELSTAQALQLAEAAATLSGGGSSGFVDRIRRGLGVDVLDVDVAGAVSVGKYIADDLFVRYRQGIAGESNVVVEYELTPSISVESDVGTAGQSRVGVSWEFDY